MFAQFLFLLLNIDCCLGWFVTICLARISFLGVAFLGGEILDFSKVISEVVWDGSLQVLRLMELVVS